MKRLDQEQFINLARRLPEDASVPYAFEKRVLARIRALPSLQADLSTAWARLLWKAAAVCLAITFATGALATFVEEPAPPEILPPELEQTVLAPIVLEQEAW